MHEVAGSTCVSGHYTADKTHCGKEKIPESDLTPMLGPLCQRWVVMIRLMKPLTYNLPRSQGGVVS
jgi:hypothetical protein